MINKGTYFHLTARGGLPVSPSRSPPLAQTLIPSSYRWYNVCIDVEI